MEMDSCSLAGNRCSALWCSPVSYVVHVSKTFSVDAVSTRQVVVPPVQHFSNRGSVGSRSRPPPDSSKTSLRDLPPRFLLPQTRFDLSSPRKSATTQRNPSTSQQLVLSRIYFRVTLKHYLHSQTNLVDSLARYSDTSSPKNQSTNNHVQSDLSS